MNILYETLVYDTSLPKPLNMCFANLVCLFVIQYMDLKQKKLIILPLISVLRINTRIIF
jgi:hypothetical protein